MTKLEFIESLRARLAGLPQEEINARTEFYVEMIHDRMEEGESEAEAVAAVGSVDDVAREILAQIPLGRLVKQKVKPQKKLSAAEILLLVLGSPLWLALLLGAFGVAVGVVVGLLGGVIALLASLWATCLALAAVGVAGVPAGLLLAVTGHGIAGVGLVGAALACLGLSIFAYYVSKYTTKATLWLFKKSILGVKYLILKGGRDRA